VVEHRFGVQFPDSYVEAIRNQRGLTRCRVAELYPPDQSAWLEDTGYGYDSPQRTILMIGMHLRGDARPLVLMRSDPSAPTLDDAIHVSRLRSN